VAIERQVLNIPLCGTGENSLRFVGRKLSARGSRDRSQRLRRGKTSSFRIMWVISAVSSDSVDRMIHRDPEMRD
jgi:hypothetical protein